MMTLHVLLEMHLWFGTVADYKYTSTLYGKTLIIFEGTVERKIVNASKLQLQEKHQVCQKHEKIKNENLTFCAQASKNNKQIKTYCKYVTAWKYLFPKEVCM